jgi:predicted ArsR family transcriptional regulator
MQPNQTTAPAPAKARKRAAESETPKPKKAQLTDLLRAKGGVSVPQISEALGWQPHTVRAALTGLRKDNVAVEKLPPRDGEPTRYRISAKRTRAAQ